MRTILHILTQSPDELAQSLIEQQKSLPEAAVEIADLSASPDYDALLDRIFAADSIEVH